MLPEEYAKLDELAAPNCYAVPSTENDIAYIVHFQNVCRRYHINFASADQDERDFVIHMAEKEFYSKRA